MMDMVMHWTLTVVHLYDVAAVGGAGAAMLPTVPAPPPPTVWPASSVGMPPPGERYLVVS